MKPRIETIPEKKLVGQRLNMSLAHDKTYQLWHRFMPVRRTIANHLTTDLFCVQVYDDSFDFQAFHPDREFEKWAAMEVSDFSAVPDAMETYTLPGGLYAVFIHQGAAQTAAKTFQYIFGTWLPTSGYTLDNRPHFEVLGAAYKNDDPTSEEDVWIPIKPRA